MLKKMSLGNMGANCFIYSDDATKDCIVFDPGDEIKRINRYIKENELTVKAIFLTHGHIDHIGMIGSMHDCYPTTTIYIHEEDQVFLTNANYNLSSMFTHQPFVFHVPYQALHDKETIQIHDISITCLHFPGHTPGSCMYAIEPEHILISGDVLFVGSIGRYDLPLGNHHDSMQSVQKIKQLDPNFHFYPGHGNGGLLADEFMHNPFFR